MKDIRIDADGELRCWNCGSKNFTHKRTFRAKAIGATAAVATGGLAAAATPMLTKKKLKCLQCGKYNDVGSAKPFQEPVTSAAPSRLFAPTAAPAAASGPSMPARTLPPRYAPADREPIIAKGNAGHIAFDGHTVTVKHTFVAATEIPIEQVRGVRFLEATMGQGGVWIERQGFATPTKKKISTDPAGLAFTKKQRPAFEALAAAIAEHEITNTAGPEPAPPAASGPSVPAQTPAIAEQEITKTAGPEPEPTVAVDAPASAPVPPPPPPAVPAGWYPDAQNPALQRYWDGQVWTKHTAPAGPPQ